MTTDKPIELYLYVAGGLPNSLRALANVRAYCKGAPPGRFRLTVCDVLEDPERALADSILLTPQLVAIDGTDRHVLVGDMTDLSVLRRVLMVDGAEFNGQ